MSIPSKPTRRYDEFTVLTPVKSRARDAARALAIRMLGLGRDIGASTDWLRFPFYHHVFDDERQGFAAQMDLLGNYGEFISIDDAVSMLEGGAPIDGRYFCLSFDDGLKSCFDGALPVLVERDIPAVFYLVSGLVGQSLEPDDPVARQVFGFKGAGTTLDFLSWDDCRKMAASGMTFGSHTCNHIKLSESDAGTARREMAESKAVIEREVGACDHFCPPYGIPGLHYDPARDPDLARACGYQSFATGARGANHSGGDPFAIRRDQLLGNWGAYQLQYFFSRG